MRSTPKLIALALLILVAAVACAGDVSNDSTDGPAEAAGPALVMFYTDN
jgi:hypothetical protein